MKHFLLFLLSPFDLLQCGWVRSGESIPTNLKKQFNKVMKRHYLLFLFLLVLQLSLNAQDRIYWGIPSRNISSAKLDGTDVKLSVALSGQTFDMETDFYKGILYWGDDRYVKKANTDGTNLQTLYTSTGRIGGLALDLINNKLYFSDYGSGKVIIRRCNLDGTGMEVIVTSPNSNLNTYNLTISTTIQKLYWTESTISNTNSIIMRCNLDGTNVETVKTTTSFIPGLTIDEKNQRLYLAYWTDNKVMTTDMTCSTTPTLVFGSSNGTFQMAVSNVDDKLYFGEMTTNKIRSCNLDGSSPQDIVSGLSGRPMALSIPTVPPAPTINANETYTFELNDFLFASVDKNLLTKVKITTLTGKGTLYLDANSNNIIDAGEAVVLNQEIAKADLVAGTLKFNPVANDYGSPYTTFNFKWFDGTIYSTLDYLQYIYVLSVAPTVTTQAVSDIGSTTATGNGNITNLGVPFPTSYGVCWNTTGSPTTSDSKVDKGPISTTGAFTAAITGLTANTTYKARAYAINEAGTSYGLEVTFTTTSGLVAPTATTNAATSITATGATLNGSINANNASTTVTFEYGLDTSYGITITAVESPVTGSSATSVSKAISGLAAGTTYHYRVTGINAGGTANGSDQSFTTPKQSQTITFNALPVKTYGDADFSPEATASSGLTVSCTSSDSNVATIVGGMIHIVGTGTCTIYADQSGDNIYNAAPQVIQQLTVNKATLTVTADAKTKVYGDANPSPLTATISGFVLAQTLATSGVTGKASVTTLADESSPVGSYTLTAALGTLASDNYSFSFVDGSLSVNKATLTVMADPKFKIYGDTNPALTFRYSGWKNSETETVLDTNPTASTTVTNTTSVGTYTDVITVSGGSDNNYTFSYVPANMEVTKASLTVTADAKTKVYGDVNPALTFQYSGWKNSETETVLDTKPTASTTVTNTTSVRTYTDVITVSGGSDNNYTFSYVPANMEVTKAALTVTADSKTKVYGDVNPALTFKYSGWKNGETETVLDTKPTASTSISASTPAGTYEHAITVSGGNDNNYDFTYISANFSVNKGKLVIWLDQKTKNYGDENPTLTYRYTGFMNGDDEFDLDYIPYPSTSVTRNTNVGTYSSSITMTGGLDNNYLLVNVPANFIVNKAPLTVKADDKTKAYGETNPELTVQYSGWVNGDDETVLDTKPIASTTVDQTTVVGTYEITVAGGLDNNYVFSYVPANLEVTKATLIVTADNQTKAYGDVNPELTFQYSGWANGDNETVLDIKPTASTTVNETTGVGTYKILVSVGIDNNYDFLCFPGRFDVTGPRIAGDTNGDGKITAPEIAGDADGNGKIEGSEIAGDINGDGNITLPELIGDVNGNGKIDGSEVAGDANGNGKLDGNESIPTGINTTDRMSTLIAYSIGNTEIRLKGPVSEAAVATLYDMQGRVIVIKQLEAGDMNVIPTPYIKAGVYLLWVKDQTRIQTLKVPVTEK